MATKKKASINWNALFEAAEHGRTLAYAPYSQFQVGAALWLENGSVVIGSNIENASYGLTVCAERNAIGSAVLLSQRPIACAIVVDSEMPTPPCGACRQVLAEFGEQDMPIRSRTLSGEEARYTLGKLLPSWFSGAYLSPARKKTRR